MLVRSRMASAGVSSRICTTTANLDESLSYHHTTELTHDGCRLAFVPSTVL